MSWARSPRCVCSTTKGTAPSFVMISGRLPRRIAPMIDTVFQERNGLLPRARSPRGAHACVRPIPTVTQAVGPTRFRVGQGSEGRGFTSRTTARLELRVVFAACLYAGDCGPGPPADQIA